MLSWWYYCGLWLCDKPLQPSLLHQASTLRLVPDSLTTVCVLPIVLTLNIKFLAVSEAYCILKHFSPAHPPVHFITGYNVCFLQGFDCIEFSRLPMFCKQHLDRGSKKTTVKTQFRRRQEGTKSRKTLGIISGCNCEEAVTYHMQRAVMYLSKVTSTQHRKALKVL